MGRPLGQDTHIARLGGDRNFKLYASSVAKWSIVGPGRLELALLVFSTLLARRVVEGVVVVVVILVAGLVGGLLSATAVALLHLDETIVLPLAHVRCTMVGARLAESVLLGLGGSTFYRLDVAGLVSSGPLFL